METAVVVTCSVCKQAANAVGGGGEVVPAGWHTVVGEPVRAVCSLKCLVEAMLGREGPG